MVLATLASQGSTDLLLINLIVNASVCVGLCGMAVGLGARLPMLKETNPAKIANGLGGTVNLVASVALVAAVLGLCFLIGYRFRQLGGPEVDTTTLLLTGAIVGLGILAAAVPMWIGTRHFARLQH